MEDVGTPDIEAPSEKVSTDDLSFKDAFSMARKGGDKSFTWRGKKYTTDVAGDKKPAASVTKETTVEVSSAPRRANLAPRGANSPTVPVPKKSISGAIAARMGTMAQRERGAKEGYKPGDIGRAFAARFGTMGQRERGKAEGYETNFKRGGMVPTRSGVEALKVDRKASIDGVAARGKTKGTVIKMASGGSVGSASRRADGIAQRGKTRGRMV